MNRDTVIGFVLIALVLIVFSWYNQPSAEQIEAKHKEDSIAAVMKRNAEKKQQADEAARKAQAEAAAMGDSTALFFSALNGTSEQIVLKNGKVNCPSTQKAVPSRRLSLRTSKIRTTRWMSPSSMTRPRR